MKIMKYDIFGSPLCNTTTIRIPRPKMVFKKITNPTPYGPLNFDRVILRDISGAKSFLKYNSKHGYSKSDKEMACKSKEITL